MRADRRALLQVLLNLLNNAVKFTEPGGTVTLSASVMPGKEFAIAVVDTGIGIDARRLPHVFEPFQRIDPYCSRRHGGSGLGLSISKMIVERHGGRLSIESRLGVGTTVTIHVPPERQLLLAEGKPTKDARTARPTRIRAPAYPGE
ncbi:MAG: hypothetical protein HYR63_16985 [Proteobacteria bacterium]|nr:hypothetical protein [Pseudomonadota bacterium]MBI3499930.1 hypothetical protein [Pseudomonadota bacterium]